MNGISRPDESSNREKRYRWGNDKKVEIEDKLLIALLQRILKISNKRSIVEMSYALIKSVFHGGHILVTATSRVGVKAMFVCLTHNLSIVLSLQKRG
ncbi:MAG: hypothetical protein QW046_05955, partial [Candidatus Micrarchaeaceae archaeon]